MNNFNLLVEKDSFHIIPQEQILDFIVDDNELYLKLEIKSLKWSRLLNECEQIHIALADHDKQDILNHLLFGSFAVDIQSCYNIIIENNKTYLEIYLNGTCKFYFEDIALESIT